MRNITSVIILAVVLLSVGNHLQAQSKTGCISFNELLNAMPDYKKADTALAKYRDTLEQEYDAYRTEYAEQDNLLKSGDTAKYTSVQLRLKKSSLAEILSRLQGYEEEASLLLDQKRQLLLLPIQKKASAAIEAVSKENGYAFILEKDALHVYPPSEDILPLVKKRLGLR
jgi:outer membrane protein